MMRSIRLELARNPEFPEGGSAHGYELTAPLHSDGSLDEETWKTARQACTVRRFWAGAEDELGRLVHARNRSWAFHYDGTDSDHDEPIFRFDRHRFVEGEYVSITEHDGVQRTFRVVRVR
jgi:hypothetical protein